MVEYCKRELFVMNCGANYIIDAKYSEKDNKFYEDDKLVSKEDIVFNYFINKGIEYDSSNLKIFILKDAPRNLEMEKCINEDLKNLERKLSIEENLAIKEASNILLNS